MSLVQSQTLWCVAALARIFLVSSEASSPQPSSPALSDEILKVKRLVDRGGDNVAFSESTADKPVQLDDRRDSLSQQPELSPWAEPETQSAFFQGTVQEMSNLLASNRKLRHDLDMMQKREAEAAKERRQERAQLNQELTNIAEVADSSTKANAKYTAQFSKQLAEEREKEQELAIANQKLQQSNAELQQSSTELQVANAKLEASNGELLGARTKLVAANAELQSVNKELQGANKQFEAANSKLQAANSELQTGSAKLQSANEQLVSKLELTGQVEKELEVAKTEAEQKARKAEKEAAIMASDMRAAQISMQHTQEMVRKLFPSIKSQLQRHGPQLEAAKHTPTDSIRQGSQIQAEKTNAKI